MRRHLLKHAPLALILATAALVSGAAFFCFETSATRRAEIYSSHLSDARTHEYVSVQGKAYSVALGIVRDAQGSEIQGADALPALTLAYAMTTSRRTPPLAFPDIEPHALENVAREISDAAALVATEQKSRRDSIAVKHNLYPARFLSSAAEAERARRAFLENGTRATLAVYETALANMLTSYSSDLARFTGSFETLVPADIGRYATDRHLVARADIVRTLYAFRGRIGEIENRTQERRRCFRGEISSCTVSDLTLPDIKSPLPVNIDGLSHAKKMHSLLQSSGIPLSSERFVRLQESACIKDRPGRGLFFSDEHVDIPGTSLRYDAPFFVGDALFMDTEPLAELPFYSFFRAQGVRYILMRPVAFYTCPLADIDTGAVLSTKLVATFAEESPLSAYRPSLAALETRLRESEVLEESDALAYLHAGRTLLESGVLSPNDANRLTELLLARAQGGNGIYHTALDIASGEPTELLTKARGVNTDFSALFRFFPRSGSVSLFSGVMNEDERIPFFDEKPLSKGNQPIVRYDDIISTGVSDKILSSDIATYTRIHSFNQ